MVWCACKDVIFSHFFFSTSPLRTKNWKLTPLTGFIFRKLKSILRKNVNFECARRLPETGFSCHFWQIHENCKLPESTFFYASWAHSYSVLLSLLSAAVYSAVLCTVYALYCTISLYVILNSAQVTEKLLNCYHLYSIFGISGVAYYSI